MDTAKRVISGTWGEVWLEGEKNSRMAIAIGEAIRDGRDIRFTIISKLADPDAYGAERVVLKNVSFDDLTLADWETGKTGTVTVPFTFTEYEYLDVIARV